MEFEIFYQNQRRKLYGYLLGMTGDRDLSMDLVQESFARCLARYAENDNPAPILFTIARNLAYDHFRSRNRFSDAEIPEEPAGTNPETELLTRERTERLLKSLQRLPEGEREILSLAAVRSLSYKEIARVTDITEANVKVRVHRARKHLRQLLEESP